MFRGKYFLVSLGSRCLWIAAALGLVCGALAGTATAAPDPKKVVGPKKCGQCHESAVKAWKESKHAKGFRSLTKNPRRKVSRKIAKAMNVRLIKRGFCAGCHYTSIPRGNRTKAIAGVSCESCHGAAVEWVDVHQEFGDDDNTAKKNEAPEHREMRLSKIKAAGMIRPVEIYRLASGCLGCHTVPNEKLVNVGSHPPGSDFELVAWSQGEVLHNFVASEGKQNAEASAEVKRVLFLVGQAVKLEYNLRGLAKASADGVYAQRMAARVAAAIESLKRAAGLVKVTEIDVILAAVSAVELKPNHSDALLAAAEKVAEAAKKLSDPSNGGAWEALDPMIPQADAYKGTPAP